MKFVRRHQQDGHNDQNAAYLIILPMGLESRQDTDKKRMSQSTTGSSEFLLFLLTALRMSGFRMLTGSLGVLLSLS